MTFYKVLKQSSKAGFVVTAYARQNKFTSYTSYEITVARHNDSIIIAVYPCAKTTVNRKFKQVIDSL